MNCILNLEDENSLFSDCHFSQDHLKEFRHSGHSVMIEQLEREFLISNSRDAKLRNFINCLLTIQC